MIMCVMSCGDFVCDVLCNVVFDAVCDVLWVVCDVVSGE